MKFPFKRRPAQPGPAAKDDPPDQDSRPENVSIDISVPRECVYQAFEDEPGPCPRCGGLLQQNYQTYVIATRRGDKITDSFITGTDFGWFCTNCPTVVINPQDVNQLLQTPLSHWDVGNQFVVLGIVDMEAIPPQKRNQVLGDDDNPIPLIMFTNYGDTAPRRDHTSSGRRRRPKSRARRR